MPDTVDNPSTGAFPIPDEALDDRLGIVGTAGSGKTYNAGAAVERLIESGARVVIVDPLDVWWGLRLTADGNNQAFALPIFGGAHGDLPLNERAGKLIGETVATMGESCIVSLGGFPTKEAERRFMLDFLESLYRKAGGDPFHVVFDEADLWAPQGAGSGAGPKLQALMEQIVRRGRVKGFIPWLITQRPAVISKDVLSQVDGLVAFKLTSSHDRDAIGNWVKGQADLEQWKSIWSQFPTMQQGEGVVWVPARGILETAKFPLKRTFDSSRSPKRGEKRERRDLQPLDLAKLQSRLSSIEEEAKVNDPAALRVEVARLQRELLKAERAKAAPPPPVVANAEQVAQARAEGETVGIAKGIELAQNALKALAKGGVGISFVKPAPTAAHSARANGGAAPAPIARSTIVLADGITKPQQRILDALAWWEAFGIDKPTNEQVGFVAGYAPSSGNFNNLKRGLSSAGLVRYPVPGRVSLTDDGRALANAPSVAPTRAAFHDAVRAKLKGPQVRLLEPALSAYPNHISTEELADAAGYAAGSGNFNNLRGSIKTIGLIDYPAPGLVRANDWLFP